MHHSFSACLVSLVLILSFVPSHAEAAIELEGYIRSVGCELNQVDQAGIEFANLITKSVTTPGQAAQLLLNYGFFDYQEFDEVFNTHIERNVYAASGVSGHVFGSRTFKNDQAYQILKHFQDLAFSSDETIGSNGTATIDFLSKYRDRLTEKLPKRGNVALTPNQIRIRQTVSLIDTMTDSLDQGQASEALKMVGRVLRQRIASEAVAFYFNQYGYSIFEAAPTKSHKLVNAALGLFLGIVVDALAVSFNIELIQDHWFMTLIAGSGGLSAIPWLHYHFRKLKYYDVDQVFQHTKSMNDPVLYPDGTIVFAYNEDSTQPIDLQTAIQLNEVGNINPLDVGILGKKEIDKLMDDSNKIQSILLTDSRQANELWVAATKLDLDPNFQNRVNFIAALKSVDASAHLPDGQNVMKALLRDVEDLQRDFTALQKFALTGYQTGQANPNDIAIGELLNDRMRQNLKYLGPIIKQLESAAKLDQEAQKQLNAKVIGWIRQAEDPTKDAREIAREVMEQLK